MDRRDAAEHLRFFGEMGITGVSRDPAWRARPGITPGVISEAARDAAPQTQPGESHPEITPGVISAAPGMSTAEAAAALQAVREDIGECVRCKLCKLGRSKIVFGTGNPRAELMFVGEAPGADEDQQGEPFVGRAGQLLTKIIEAIGLTRDQVYIANVIKCRPPGNRNPEPDEVATCEPFLFRQIDIIRPRIIVALGTHAAHALLKTDAPISRIRGVVHEYRGGSKLVPTFHPAYLLRSPDRKRDVWEDMKKVRALLDSRDSGD